MSDSREISSLTQETVFFIMKQLNSIPALVALAAVTFLAFASAVPRAADAPYNESADAKADVKLALSQGEKSKVPVLLVFGANWCGDCKVLDSALTSGSVASLVSRDFKIVKIDVGRFNKNTDLAEMYGVPLKKGIPAVVVVSANANASQNRVLYVTKAGELADARSMGDKGIYEFFRRVSTDTKPRS